MTPVDPYLLVDVGSDPGPEPHRDHLQRASDELAGRGSYVTEHGVYYDEDGRRDAAREDR